MFGADHVLSLRLTREATEECLHQDKGVETIGALAGDFSGRKGRTFLASFAHDASEAISRIGGVRKHAQDDPRSGKDAH